MRAYCDAAWVFLRTGRIRDDQDSSWGESGEQVGPCRLSSSEQNEGSPAGLKSVP